MRTFTSGGEAWTVERSGGSHTSDAAALNVPPNRHGMFFRRVSDGFEVYGWLSVPEPNHASLDEIYEEHRQALLREEEKRARS